MRRVVETAIAQARGAVTRLNRPTVNIARTARQAAQVGHNSASGTTSQNDQALAPIASRVVAGSAQPPGPRKARTSSPSTATLQNRSAPVAARTSPNGVGSAGLKKN